jgi:hypothetical protein
MPVLTTDPITSRIDLTISILTLIRQKHSVGLAVGQYANANKRPYSKELQGLKRPLILRRR